MGKPGHRMRSLQREKREQNAEQKWNETQKGTEGALR